MTKRVTDLSISNDSISTSPWLQRTKDSLLAIASALASSVFVDSLLDELFISRRDRGNEFLSNPLKT